MRFEYQVGDQVQSIDIDKTPEGYRATVGGESFEVQVIQVSAEQISFMIGDRPYSAQIGTEDSRRWLALKGERYLLGTPAPANAARAPGKGQAHSADNRLAAPMPGQVRAIQVSQGDHVEMGQTLILLEAMKMEIRIQAPREGKIAGLLVHPGQTVEREQILVELE